MKRKMIISVSWLVLCIMLFSITATAQGTVSLTDETISLPTEDFDTLLPGEEDASVMSIAQPVKAYLAVNTYCYLAPNSSTGYRLAAIPQNTDVWVVEKVWCAADDCYYYYCGFTYNSASHRGYFHEDNVYRNGSRYLPADIDAETKPADMKVHTSLAGTVYAGPAETYATVGSVGQESIKLIRTEGDYNFIEYTVTSTGKLKRGFLHYSKITGSWADLTARNAALDGKTFYIRYTPNQQYWGTYNGSGENTRIQMQTFTGDTNQIFKFVYDSEHKFFYIQPAVAYDVDRRIAIRWVSGTEHADRRLFLKDSAVVLRQQFWVVKVTGYSNRYKIIPRSSYGTMTLASRSGYVNQYYTTPSTESGDVWTLETTKKSTSTLWVSQEGKPWCWAASGKMLASSETPGNYSASLSSAVIAVKNELSNDDGNTMETTQVANYFMNGNINSNYFKSFDEPTNYPESILRRFIAEDHSVSLLLRNNIINQGHYINLVGFEWNDTDRQYKYFYYDPDYMDAQRTTKYETLRAPNSTICSVENSFWQYTAVYKVSYAANTISPAYY